VWKCHWGKVDQLIGAGKVGRRSHAQRNRDRAPQQIGSLGPKPVDLINVSCQYRHLNDLVTQTAASLLSMNSAAPRVVLML
jgi:hypothetical protein